MDSFYSLEELSCLGLKKYGLNVLISRKASLYFPEKISLGNNVRIDDYCILSGEIAIGSFVHISAYSAIYGSSGVVIESYSGLSPRCTIFSVMDDFSGNYMINPMVDNSLRKVTGGPVYLKKYVQIGAGSIIFPNLTVGVGSVVGAMSLVNSSIGDWGVYVGVPVNRIKNRSNRMLDLLIAESEL